MMQKIKQTVKTGTIFGLMAGFVAHSALVGLQKRQRWSRAQRRAKLASSYSKLALKVLGIEIDTRGHLPRRHDTALYVGNHLSYLDILIFSSQVPTSFVTSEEIRAVPVLGTLCELGGCLFVERRSRAKLDAEVSELTEALQHGLNVTIFPEATSTNGESVLRFRRPLFQAAKAGTRPVAPFCLNYRSLDHEALSVRNRDKICWYGDMEFVSHLWNLTAHKTVQAEMTWLDRQFEHVSSEQMALAAHEAVSQSFTPIDEAKAEEEMHFPIRPIPTTLDLATN